ncbi:D-glycero-beta-D-manno-heptose-7-phosphate kinase [Desulfovibrio sp. OttesenSCG-928-A18]|nr:D-glycero-beta-D-manno-heptose-7-phosphate kinase [Desulfovibrio sp. OttesenSCG-928-A18]
MNTPLQTPAVTQDSERSRLQSLLPALEGAAVLLIGDCMLDSYLTGEADRISPEAPVPVVRVERERHLLGGVGNVARNIAALGGKGLLLGIRGQDQAGEELERNLRESGISHALLPLAQRPTTIKTRVLARKQQVLRFDREEVSPLPEEHTQTLLQRVRQHLPACGALVVSDYGKGVVTRSCMLGLLRIIEEDGRGIPLLVDPKPMNFSLYSGVSMLTPNARETSESVNMPVRTREEIIAAGQKFMDRLDCRHLLTTLGEMGMALFQDRNNIYHIPTSARAVFDVTGAGDTVISILALALAAGISLLDACQLANYAAGIVVAEVGAAVATRTQINDSILQLPLPQIARWL